MYELAVRTLGVTIAVFVFTSLLSLGLDLTVRQIVDPLRDRRLLGRALMANVVLVPLFALALTLILPIDESARIGLLLYACCIGSEGAPKFAQLAGGNAALAVALLGVFLAITVIGVPLALGYAFPEVDFPQGALAAKLLLVVALPMSIGLIIKANWSDVAARAAPTMHRISSLLLLLVLSQVVYANIDKFMAMQTLVLLAGLVFFAFAFAAGYGLGGPTGENRRALGIMTTVRGGSIAMMIAGQAFPHDTAALVVATALTAMSVVIVVPGSFVLRRMAI